MYPKNYKYSFNNECFTNCEDSKNYYYDLNIISKSENECKCANLWKNNGDKINCLNSDVCFSEEDNKIYLNIETLECLEECPTNYKIFNYKCYENNCPELTKIENVNNNECKCIYKWYKYNDTIFNLTDLVKCLKENEECKDYNFPYYNDITRECLKDLSECPSTKKKV